MRIDLKQIVIDTKYQEVENLVSIQIWNDYVNAVKQGEVIENYTLNF